MPLPRILLGLAAALAATPTAARMSLPSREEVEEAMRPGAMTYLQCVPYARQLTGIQIYGDAHTWWNQAEGRYARGFQPKVGAVMAFRPYGNSTLGHVAAVSRVIDRRTILVSHANWSPIEGRRGQIEDNVRVVDVSPDNDWSLVRVWYAPLQALGSGQWPVEGFIYPTRPGKAERLDRGEVRMAVNDSTQASRKTDPIADIIRRKLRW